MVRALWHDINITSSNKTNSHWLLIIRYCNVFINHVYWHILQELYAALCTIILLICLWNGGLVVYDNKWRIIVMTSFGYYSEVPRTQLNTPISQISECTCSISHNAPRRTGMHAFVIWNMCILGFVNFVFFLGEVAEQYRKLYDKSVYVCLLKGDVNSPPKPYGRLAHPTFIWLV